MKKFCITLLTLFAFFVIIPLSANEIDTYISTTDTIRENEWLYTGLTSYQGSNTASFVGDATGYGKLEYIEQIDLWPNSVACSKTGNPQDTLSCSSTVSSNSKSQTRGRYTNLTGSTSATVTMED